MVSKRQASGEQAANKWQASSKQAAVMLLPAQRGWGGFKETLTPRWPRFRGSKQGSPLSPSRKSTRSARLQGARAGGTCSLDPPPGVTPGPAGAKRRRQRSKEDLLLNARGFRGNNFPSS